MSETTLTHPETAWLVASVPLFLTLSGLLLITLLTRGRLLMLLRARLSRRAAQRNQPGTVDAALLFAAPVVTPERLLLVLLSSALVVIAGLSQLTGVLLAILLAGPAVALTLWLTLVLLEQRYIARLDAELVNAVGRLRTQLAGGTAVAQALEQVVSDLPAGPLRAEWGWIVRRFGAPLATGRLALAQDVVLALLEQTPSRRHAAFLQQLEVALGQPQHVLARRVGAAYDALHKSQQRRSQAITALAHMRYTGVVIFLAGAGMQVALVLLMRARWIAAFSSGIGIVVGVGMAVAMLTPLVGGFWLSRVEDLDY